MSVIKIFTDGGARGNPGPAAIGFVVYCHEKLIFQGNAFIGRATNNVAEYTAVLQALEWLDKNINSLKPLEKIFFMLDSLLVVQQLKGKFKIKNPGLLNLAIKIKALEKKLAVEIVYINIPREQNVQADKLVNLALDKLL